MTAIVLGWDPDRRDGWQFAYTSILDTVRATGFAAVAWPAHSTATPGADAWIILQGATERGLLGHGIVATPAHDDAGSLTIDVDLLLPRGEHIPESVLLGRVPDFAWGAGLPAGTPLAAADEQLVRAVWAEHVSPSDADPVAPIPGTLPASALTRTLVNRYEQDPDARRLCVAHHGTGCTVCGFDFEATYGELGRGFIQLHHIVPGLQLTSDYVLDPVTDLVPLCPNCHAMAHRRTPDPYSPAELRRLIRGSSHLEGEVVSPEELLAQADARRIMGTQNRDQ
ncbi:HNH endonuclease [Arthrobacter sp. CAN_A1]|uniref:HNH endonuclease n=1 Tax=Arthrobacter sp. CAN_A1 TaxID=2787717 RepID=UPI0018C90BF1